MLTIAAVGALLMLASLPASAQSQETEPHVAVQQGGQFGPGATTDSPGVAEPAGGRENDLELAAPALTSAAKVGTTRRLATELEQSREFQTGERFGRVTDRAVDRDLDLQETFLARHLRP